jgi:hypothetical protein
MLISHLTGEKFIAIAPNDQRGHVNLSVQIGLHILAGLTEAAIVVNRGSQSSRLGEGVLVGLHNLWRK